MNEYPPVKCRKNIAPQVDLAVDMDLDGLIEGVDYMWDWVHTPIGPRRILIRRQRP